MRFHDRQEAGKLLAFKLKKYAKQNVVIYAIPRGGVVTAFEVSNFLKAPLDLVITRKIGHPHNPEYAIAAISESGEMIGNPEELEAVSKDWLENEKRMQMDEIIRRKKLYLKGKQILSPKEKIAILVDDGVATGLTLRVGIKELRHLGAKEIVAAVPIAPESTSGIIKEEADEFITVKTISDDKFLNAVGAYYEDFAQVDGEEVVSILEKSRKN